MKITNTQPGGIGLPGGLVIPPMGSADVDDAVWAEAAKHPVIAGRIKQGHLLPGDRAAQSASEDDPTPEVAELREKFATAYTALQAKAEGLERDVADRDARIADLEKQLAAAKASSAPAAQPPAASPYAVEAKPGGWFAVTQDGAEVTKSLRKDDLGDFDALSEEAKAAFVEKHKAAS